jgi:hypothetical protein
MKLVAHNRNLPDCLIRKYGSVGDGSEQLMSPQEIISDGLSPFLIAMSQVISQLFSADLCSCIYQNARPCRSKVYRTENDLQWPKVFMTFQVQCSQPDNQIDACNLWFRLWSTLMTSPDIISCDRRWYSPATCIIIRTVHRGLRCVGIL